MTALRDELEIPAPIGEATEECPHLSESRGDWFDIYAILVSPELVTIDGTCRDQIKVLRCPDGHLHLPIPITWVGPIAPIGFAEFWERKANLTGEPLVRLQSNVRELPAEDRLTVGPGRLS